MYRFIPCLLLICLAAQAQESQTVYRAVDESGAVSFSDTPPAGDGEVEEITVDVAPPQDPDTSRRNLEDMRETTDRMAEDRRAREKHRAQLRELAARSAAAEQPPQNLIEQYSTPWYHSGWGGYHRPGRPPWRPGHPIRPEQPIYRPPVEKPLPAHPLQGNSQLMRPILPRGK